MKEKQSKFVASVFFFALEKNAGLAEHSYRHQKKYRFTWIDFWWLAKEDAEKSCLFFVGVEAAEIIVDAFIKGSSSSSSWCKMTFKWKFKREVLLCIQTRWHEASIIQSYISSGTKAFQLAFAKAHFVLGTALLLKHCESPWIVLPYSGNTT